MRARFLTCAVLAAAVALPFAALAGHGKAGLWNITLKISTGRTIPPDQLAKLKAQGLDVPNGNTMIVQRCVTPEEAASNKPPMQSSGGCTMENLKTTGSSYSADMVCSSAEMKGRGHFQVSYDSNTHYSGQISLSGVANGRPTAMTNRFEGRWISASCGNAGH